MRRRRREDRTAPTVLERRACGGWSWRDVSFAWRALLPLLTPQEHCERRRRKRKRKRKRKRRKKMRKKRRTRGALPACRQGLGEAASQCPLSSSSCPQPRLWGCGLALLLLLRCRCRWPR
jgi:hypothetical protein